jgi:membrane protein insertase Oxa1/YidC/SpoIIIJ
MKRTLLKATGLGAVLSLLPMAAHAVEDFSTTSTDTATNAAAGTAAAGFVGVILIFWLIALVVGIAFFVFWIIMLIDAFKRTNWQDENQKNLWLVILIVSIFVGLSWLAAVLYYFIIKRALDTKATVTPAASETPKQ